MITGGYDEAQSPEARNARPFVNLRAAAAVRAPRHRRGTDRRRSHEPPSLAAAPPRRRRSSASTGASSWRCGSGALISIALGGCDWKGPPGSGRVLRAAERWNERVERALFRHRAMNTAPAGARAAGEAFPGYFISPEVPVWDEAARGTWRLEVGGLVERPLRLTLAELTALPRTELRLDHFCVEGWTAVAVRAGVRVSDLARLAGVSPDARVRRLPVVRRRLPRELGPRQRAAPADADRVRPGRQAAVTGVRRARARVFAGEARLQIDEVPDQRHVPAHERNGGYWSDQGYEWYAGT